MKINGKPVINGQRAFNLRIIPADIKKGQSKSPAGCAAAVALVREHKDITAARVHLGRIFIEGPSAWVRYKTPHTLRDEIVAYDRGGTFMPGHHEIIPLTKSEQRYIDDKEWRKQLVRKRENENKRGERKTRAVRHIVSGVRPRGANR